MTLRHCGERALLTPTNENTPSDGSFLQAWWGGWGEAKQDTQWELKIQDNLSKPGEIPFSNNCVVVNSAWLIFGG